MPKGHPVPEPTQPLPRRTKGTGACSGRPPHPSAPSHLVLSSGQALHGRPASGQLVQCRGQGGQATLVQPSSAVSPHSSGCGHTARGTCPHAQARCSRCSQMLTSKVTSRAKQLCPFQGLWAHSDPWASSIAVGMSPPAFPRTGSDRKASAGNESSAQPCSCDAPPPPQALLCPPLLARDQACLLCKEGSGSGPQDACPSFTHLAVMRSSSQCVRTCLMPP